MKRSILIALALLVLPLTVSHAARYTTKDVVTFTHNGSTETAVGVSSDNVVYATDGLVSVHERFNPPAISTNEVLNVNIPTTTLTSPGTTYVSSDLIVQPAYPTKLVFQFWLATGTPNNINKLEHVITTATVFGLKADGSSQSESLNVSTTSRKTHYAYAHVSSITVNPASSIYSTEAVKITLVVGSTGTYGLAADLERQDDVFKLHMYGIDSTSYTINTNNDTIQLDLLPGSAPDPFDVWYRNTAGPKRRR